ncbi:MAG: T9SS type A sorting domain-containing protein [Flavobacteriales bacterium]|nr:T9SS type A sorting domain-containing protein [Flavobacteriales bacterium]
MSFWGDLQNEPNPFKNNTLIKYEIQENFNKASIIIFDLQGTLIDIYPIYESGKNEIKILGSKYKPGMYIYSLLVNGKEVDTKRMILTK